MPGVGRKVTSRVLRSEVRGRIAEVRGQIAEVKTLILVMGLAFYFYNLTFNL